MGSHKIRLTPIEMLIGATVGICRHIEALTKGLPDRHGYNGDGWSIHIEGACGELAVAKVLDCYWGGSVNTFQKQPDVSSYEVRTRSKDWYELIVRKDDPDTAIFICVTGKAPSYDVVGWILGRDAKRPEWLKDHGGREAAYFVPHNSLAEIDNLKGVE